MDHYQVWLIFKLIILIADDHNQQPFLHQLTIRLAGMFGIPIEAFGFMAVAGSAIDLVLVLAFLVIVAVRWRRR